MSPRFGWLRGYALVVGLMDTVTGVLLVMAPTLVLRLMWIAGQPAETVWLRFIGAFVAGVGMMYLHPLVAAKGRSATLLAAALEFTAIARAAVGLVVAVSVANGSLPAAWCSVAVTDLSLAAVQIVLVARGAGVEASR